MSKVNMLYRNLMKATIEHAPVACQLNPDLFDPDISRDPYTRNMTIKIAKDYCAECPIQMMCREFGIVSNAEAMVWGGLTPDEIKSASRRLARNQPKNSQD